MWYTDFFNIYLSGGFGKGNKRKLDGYKNAVVFQNVFTRLINDAMARYKFNGLPDTVCERVVLQSLLWYGSVCFFEKDGGVFALPGLPSGKGYNIYGEVSDVWVYARNGVMNKEVKVFIPNSDKNSFLKQVTVGRQTGTPHGVMVYENNMRYPFIKTVLQYSDSISDTLRTIDVARKNIKSPYIVVAEESVIPTVKKYFEARDNNEEYIVSSGIFPVDKVNVLPITTTSDSLKTATELCEWYENKYREMCGYNNNTQIDKKGENLIREEVDVNNEYTNMSVDKCINVIRDGLTNVNEFFGLNITVEPVKYVEKNVDIRYNKDEEENNDSEI